MIVDPPPEFTRLGLWNSPGAYRGAVVLCTDAEDRILLQLRDDRPDILLPRVWSFFGGGLEESETPVDAVCREFAEETGINLPQTSFSPAFAVLTGAPRWAMLYVFRVARAIDPAELRLGEGAGFAFCTPAQARRLDIAHYILPVLESHWKTTFLPTESNVKFVE